MSRGGYKGRENFPHVFKVCPECGKKGLYERNAVWVSCAREEVCRYCKFTRLMFPMPMGV